MAVPKKKPGVICPRLSISDWIVFGLDLSFSRTGYAALRVRDDVAAWGPIGSFEPKDVHADQWVRGASIAVLVHEWMSGIITREHPQGVILSMETPDPHNSYLMALNGVVQTVLWASAEEGTLQALAPTYRLCVNASTLRSTLCLTSDDKSDNMALARSFLPGDSYPGLDTDACDAVLMAMMGRYVTMVLRGDEGRVPAAPLRMLCSDESRVKVRNNGEGRAPTRKETPRGLLLNPATWSLIPGQVIAEVRHTDAAIIQRKRPIVVVNL